MRYGVLGDIHGNLEALEAVLADAKESGVERILCVGDLVGYGANPVECVERLRELGTVTVAGNHDWAVVGKVRIEYFNADARDSVEWTRQRLAAEHLEYLRNLPLVYVVDGVTLVHSSPFSPEFFDYIQTRYDVQLAFEHMNTPVCFVGHSHVPVIFIDTKPIDYTLQREFVIPEGRRIIVNVGSVGQPRDLDPRGCYVIYDSNERRIYLRRVDYDLQSASERMTAAGLPATNAVRIVLGR